MRYSVKGNAGMSGRVSRVDELRGSLDYGKRTMRRISDSVNTGREAQLILTLRA